MLEREDRLRINEVFTQKQELIEKIAHNNLELDKLKEMFMAEQDADKSAQIKRSVRRGRMLVSSQKTELAQLSNTKIAEKLGIPVLQVRHQSAVFNKCNIVL